MSEYPDPDEEFELMYGDELELLKEQEEDIYVPPAKTRKSLDFGTPSSAKQNENLTRTYDNVPCDSLNSFVSDFPPLSQTDLSVAGGEVGPSNQNKRTVEELFGDIDDIDSDIIFDDNPNRKKHKGDQDDEELALIEQIVELRKLAKEEHTINISKTNYSTDSTDRNKDNLSYRVPKYPFVAITRQDKERVYVRFHSEEYEKEETQRLMKECSFVGVMGESFKEVWDEARNLINSQIDSDLTATELDRDVALIEPIDETKQLWVDLYKPRKYLELLSEESINRIMLRWIKLWDRVVFNRKPKIKPIKFEDPLKNNFFKRQELNTKLNEDGRPEHKVALLCGPPGLGKTTLAHMVAKHAGYNVVEINASDDRSTEAFKTSLENATQMRSVVDQERRPNCLVFDEIDGAPQTSIDYLVKFISGTATTKSKKGKSEKKSVLKRPIICICNDVYVPALKPLRQIAFVVNFPQTSSARLAERLMEIARRQNIKTHIGAMLALAEKSNNDIRSCLSVLHFFKAQSKAVTLLDVYKTSIGQKDIQKGLFSVWGEIFQIQRPKLPAFSASNNNHKQTLKSRMGKVLQTVSSFGDYEKVGQGVFENFPMLKLKDSSLNGLCECLDWFVFSDLINKQIYTLQNYSLTSYLQYAFVIWHFVFATAQKQKLNYPSVGYEVRMKQIRQRAVISEILRGMQPSVRAYCQALPLTLDILPFLIRVIVPPFRPVSLHLYTKEEKDNMLRVVHIMIDYNLNYIQERTPDGTYAYNLEPNVEEIVTFHKSLAFTRTRILSYSNKHLIAREIELERMRRYEAPKTTHNPKKDNGTQKPKENNKCVANLPNHLQKLQAVKSAKTIKPVIHRDFFGRIISNVSPSSAKNIPSRGNDLWYQYKEGYNNAVRKRTTISSLK